MDQTLHQLGELLLGSIPTVLLVLLLHFWFRTFLYRPVERVLGERRSRTEGKFEAAQHLLSQAEQKLAQYEEAIRQARAEAYRAIDERRRAAAEQRLTVLTRARTEVEQAIQNTRVQLTSDTEEAKAKLRAEAQRMAEHIVGTVLREAVVSSHG